MDVKGAKMLAVSAVLGLFLFGCGRPSVEAPGEAQVHPLESEEGEAPALALKSYLLPNGWSLSPMGKAMNVGDYVANLLPTPDGDFMVALNSGAQTHQLTLFDPRSATIVAQTDLASSWLGLTFSPDGSRLYVSGGNDRKGGIAPLHVLAYHRPGENGPPSLVTLDLPGFRQDLPPDRLLWSGLLHHPDKPLLYAANLNGRHVAVFDTETGDLVDRLKTGTNPYALAWSPNGRLFVSNWADDTLSAFDPENGKALAVIKVGDNPNHMTVGDDGRLYVACANDNSVVIVDTVLMKAVGRIITSMWEKAPEGSTPNFVLLDEAQQTLYVANADNNNVAVVDVVGYGRERTLGFMPTGWYPTCLALGPENAMAVGSAKGAGSTSNLRGPYVHYSGSGLVPKGEGKSGNILGLLTGTVHVFDLPANAAQLRALSGRCLKNTPYHDALLEEAVPPKVASVIPSRVGEGSPIEHIIYIIKENRTYDQVLGDMEQGNGDPRIAIFGRKVTPNHHAIAEAFVLFDNFYVDAETSADGHAWTNAAYATDFVEKTWPARKGGHMASVPETDAAEPASGYIWDLCKQAGLTYRTYGEKTNHPTFKGHVAKEYRGWPEPDDTENARVFIREFDAFEEQFESKDPNKRLPNFSVVCLPHNHTWGTEPGKFTPIASVANNDLALGMIVERVTNSKYWPKTAIFILEDDAQDGSDHVDCHRSVLLCVSPYTRRGITDSTHYTTSSVLRTMELLLGLPPMSQFDAAATPLYAAMGTDMDLTPYRCRPAEVDIYEVNKKTAYRALESMEMDLEEFDRAPMFEFNEIIWKSVRGPDSDMPLPVRRYDLTAVVK